jgi:hypothetical protein
MNKTKQFCALLRFQAMMNPFIFLMPLALGTPYLTAFFMSSSGSGFHPQLELLISNQSIWLVGFIGVMLLAPEIVQPGASNVMWSTGTEFLLTRAVDRHLVLRARSTFFLLMILTLPVLACLSTLRNPDLLISEYNKVSHQQVLGNIPGSTAEAADKTGMTPPIKIPNGNVMIESWRLWSLICVAMGAQIFIYIIYPLKYRKFILWGIFLAVIFLPLLTIGSRATEVESLSVKERIFFAFVGHQPLFWLSTIAVLILGQLWCERRFSKLEQS